MPISEVYYSYTSKGGRRYTDHVSYAIRVVDIAFVASDIA
jgi:hypothetical protein